MKVYVYLNQSGYIDLTSEPKCDNMYLEKFLGTYEMPVEEEKKTVRKEGGIINPDIVFIDPFNHLRVEGVVSRNAKNIKISWDEVDDES